MTCLTTGCLALFSSVFFKKTATSLMTTYLVIVLLFCAPLAMEFFASRSLQIAVDAGDSKSDGDEPFRGVVFRPHALQHARDRRPGRKLAHVFSYLGFSAMLNAGLMGAMIWLFNTRWRVAE